MQYRQFIKTVQDHSGFSDAEAHNATRCFMETLAARISDDEVADLTAQLPTEIADMATPGIGTTKAESADEFFEQIAAGEDIDVARAKKQAFAVWETLKVSLTPGQLSHIKSQLPKDLESALH